jgi:transposase-like protein
MKAKSLTFAQATELNEEQAREYFESILWPGGPECPHCGSKKAWDIKGASARPGVYECAECKKQFTVTVGTVMHGSHISIRQWLMAFCLMTSSKKGVSALQLQRNLGLGSYKSAWHLAHRIRFAMTEGTFRKPLKGTVEVDETYVGGKSRGGKPGRGAEKKTPVVALVERNGRVHSKPVERVNAKTLKGAIRENVHKDSCIMTDEWPAYKGIGNEFKGGHKVVNHGKKEYVRGDANTNTVESYFALLKRGVHGIFHHVSKNHLHRYCNEFSFRWNLRKTTDGDRTIGAIQGIVGKRLLYKPSVAVLN